MKFLIRLLCFAFVFFTFTMQTSPPEECKNIPPINKKIVAFVKNNLGKKIGSGACYDLVEKSYNAAGIQYYNYKIGDKVNYAADCVFPGDVLELDGCTVTFKRNDSTFGTSYIHESRIIYQVKNKSEFVTAYQEEIKGVYKLRLLPFELKSIKKGKPVIYRPIKM